MCSITDQVAAAPEHAATLAALVAHHAEVGELIAALLRDDRVAQTRAADGAVPAESAETAGRVDVGSLPSDLAASLSTLLLTSADRAVAAGTVLAGHVAATAGPGTGTLIAGTYASPRRWLEMDAGLAPSSAKAVLARARELREHSGRVADAWLAGQVSGDSVRELTAGITHALAPVVTTREEKARLRDEAVAVLLPVAQRGTPGDVRRGVARLRLLADSAFEEEAALQAFDEQSLECVRVGAMSRLTAWLTHENAAAVLTVVDQYARRIADRDPDVVHDPSCPLAHPAPPAGGSGTRWCSCGGSAAAGATSKDRWPHLLAVAFAEAMTGLLDDARVGSHHGIAPHVTLTVDLDHLRTGLGGELTVPGSDDRVLLGSESIRRILCDADLTTVVTRPVDPTAHPPAPADATALVSEQDRLAALLLDTTIAVLHVGRARRTAPARLRRALEARDQHCIYPGCHAHPRRCQAHHVREWEHGGDTSIENLALLCVRHHHAVHEGGWTITATPGTHPHQHGCWSLAPPRTQP